MPVYSLLLVCVLPLPSAHETAGAAGIRHSPRPLWAEDKSNASGASRREGEGVSKTIATSLRATGSRECAPDDRLREAIHLAARLKSGLLRRFRLRSLSYGGQVAPRNDVEYDSAIPRREAPEVCVNFFRPSITEGAGNAGR